MSEAETKTCPMCAETIKAAAKVCPFCRSKQRRFELWRQELPLAVTAVGLAAMAVMVLAWISPEEKGVGGRSFAGHRDDLIVLSNSLCQVGGKSGFWLTGVVTNRGDFPWRVHQLEIRDFDARDNMLDVHSCDVKGVFVVQPGQDHGFKAELGDVVFTNRAVRREVRVQLATDGDRQFRSD